MILPITTGDEHQSPPGEGSNEEIGRASLLASHRLSKSLPHEAQLEPRPPNFFTALPRRDFHGSCPCRRGRHHEA